MHKINELRTQYSTEVQAGVSFGGLFSTLSVFFTGLLISNYNSFPSSVRVPLLFLILSTFGFIYATLIYANASGKLKNSDLASCKRALNTADVLSEFIGVYALLISIPLVIPIITNDLFLVNSVFIVDAIGLIIYHNSGFSIMKEFFPKTHMLIAIAIIVLTLTMLLLQGLDLQNVLLTFVTLTILFLVFLSLLTINKIPKLG